MPAIVWLTPKEAIAAESVGLDRQIRSMLAGRKPAHGAKIGNSTWLHMVGARGELAFAKAMGLLWTGHVDVFHEVADVGDFEVRTRTKHWHDLIVRPCDPPRNFALVTTESRLGPYVVHGWISMQSAKQDRFLKIHGGRPAAYFVPSAALNAFQCKPTQAP